MDAIEFIKSYRRLCAMYSNEGCAGCPLRGTTLCGSLHHCDIDKFVPAVEQWAKDHPAKTRQTEFMEMYPNPIMDEDLGCISIAPCELNKLMYGYEACSKKNCQECKRGYWLQEVE